MFTIDKLNQNDDILQYAISHDIIDIEKIRENMREEQRSYYLNMHHYSVFQDQKGLWRTTFPDSSKKNGRGLRIFSNSNLTKNLTNLLNA